MFGKFPIIILFLCMFIPHINIKAEQNINIVKFTENTKIKKDAEYLYKKINDFLLKYKDIPPERFDDICKDYMTKSVTTTVKLLNKKDFEEKSKNSIVLYRSISEKQFADNLKKGIIYMSTNVRNVRGMGIYTTTSLECAKSFSDKTDSKTIIKMLMPKIDVKILENEYLEKLKEVIRTIYPEEYGNFHEKNKQNYIFDSAKKLLDEKFNKAYQKIEREKIKNINEQKRLLDELREQLEKDPIVVNRKRYFKENKASIFYNSGLLTGLLSFDVLHSVDSLREDVEYTENEYLIVEPKILSVLND